MKRLTISIALAVAATLILAAPTAAQDNNTTVEEDINQTQQTQEQQVDTVIMTTSENYHDSLIAGQVSEKYGVPVLLTDAEEIPNSTTNALDQLQPSNVVIVGGPAVVSPEIEMQLSQNYSVERVAGETAEDTASEVAQRFWSEGSEDVNLVEDQLPLIAGAIHANDAPTLLVDGNTSNTTDLAIRTLEPETANIFTTAEVGNITGNDAQEYTGSVDEILQEVRPEVSGVDTLIVTPRDNLNYSIPAPYVPNAAVISVDPENANQTLEGVEADEVWAIGPDNFSQTISDATNSDVELLTGEPSEIASDIVLRKQEVWNQLPGEELKIQEKQQNQTAIPGNETTTENQTEMNQTEPNETGMNETEVNRSNETPPMNDTETALNQTETDTLIQ